MFSLFNFSSIFLGGQLTPFVPACGRPWVCVLTAEYVALVGVMYIRRDGDEARQSIAAHQLTHQLAIILQPDRRRHEYSYIRRPRPAVCWPGAQSARDNRALALCQMFTDLKIFFTHSALNLS